MRRGMKKKKFHNNQDSLFSSSQSTLIDRLKTLHFVDLNSVTKYTLSLVCEPCNPFYSIKRVTEKKQIYVMNLFSLFLSCAYNRCTIYTTTVL